MKHIMIVMAGAADVPAEELGGKTLFETAKVPNLHFFAKNGRMGSAKLFSDRFEILSDVTLLNLLGYDADKIYTGRGPLEAANLEVKLDEHEVAFRMNFITESDNKLADDTAGSLTTKEAKALINFLNKKVASDFVRFFAGREYRHVAVLKDAHGYAALSARTACPELIVGEPVESHFPKGPGEELLRKLMFDAKLLLSDHEINQVRVDLQENPANMIWLWGQGPQPVLEKFSDVYGLSGAIVTSSEYAGGIGRLTGLPVLEIGTDEEGREDMESASKMLLSAVEEKDFVLVYLSDGDEASRSCDLRGKMTAIENVDQGLLSKVKDLVEKTKEVRVAVTTNHVFPWKTGKRIKEVVPFVMAGKNIMADDVERFSEAAGKASGLRMANGKELMKSFLSK